MGLFTMIFLVAMASIVADAAVKLVRGHPAKEKEIKTLRTRVDTLEHHIGECLASLDDARAALAEEANARLELEERLDFTERLLASGRDSPA